MEGMGKQAKIQVNNLNCCKETGFPVLRKCILHNNEGKGCEVWFFFFFPSSLLQITLSHGKAKLDFFLTLNMSSEVVTAHKCQCTREKLVVASMFWVFQYISNGHKPSIF